MNIPAKKSIKTSVKSVSTNKLAQTNSSSAKNSGQKFSRPALVIALLMIGAFLAGCGPEEKKGKKVKQKSVKAAKVIKGFIDESIKTTGDVVAVNTVTLRAAVEGPIKYCPWREGDKVKKDQKVIEIHRPLYQKELAVARAELEVKKAILNDLVVGPRPEEIAMAREQLTHWENSAKFAKVDWDRLSKLATKKVVSAQEKEKAYVNYTKSKSEYESAKEKLKMLEEGTKETELIIARTAVKKAAANVELAQAKVDECIIKAPFSGIITSVYVRPGDLTHLSSPRMPLLKIIDPTSLVVRAGLPESRAAFMTKGTKVTVELDAYPGRKFNAVIERIHPRIEWNSRTRIIEARIVDKIELLPRMFARISVQGKKFDDAVLVPDSAIITTPRGYHVIFILENGRAKMRKVKIGIEKGKLVQIISGIKAGDMAITAGNLNLKDGAPVIAINQKTKSDGKKK